jgi:hypothetical protein
MRAHCVDNDFVRCDIPVEHVELAFVAWMDFKANPASWDAFERFEWAMKVASIKFDTYASNRRIEASREKPLP